MKHHRIPLFALLVAMPAAQAFASDTRIFDGVSEEVFACVKATSEVDQGTVYVESEPNRGTATTTSTLWQVVMDYAAMPADETLQYWMVHKTWIVPGEAVWSGIEEMIDGCRTEAG